MPRRLMFPAPLLGLLLIAVQPTDAVAQEVQSARGGVQVAVGSGRLVRLGRPATTVFVADPQIADVQTAAADRLFVFGKKPGRTTLFALDDRGEPIVSWQVQVEPEQAALTGRAGAEAGPSAATLSTTAEGAVLSGRVPNPATAARLAALAGSSAGAGREVVNQLGVSQSVQVNLRVRVAEVSRTVAQQIGFNWSTIASAGSFAFGLQTGRLAGATQLVNTGTNALFGSVASRQVNGSTVLDAMATEHLVTMLAEPNLTAMSGSTATFLAGGEFPVPVPQALGVTSIQYIQYGVSVAFTPTVMGSGRISLKVRPSVSSLTQSGSYTLNGSTVPALSTRRAETEVELASGQSFAIAGLIRNDTDNNVQKVPLLGDIPVLGQLFRSTQFQRDQTELVIVVTPYLVRPTDPLHRPDDPTRHIEAPGPVERILYGRLADGRDLDSLPRLHGTGFLFE